MGDRLGIQVAVDNLLHPGDHHLAALLSLGGRTGQRRQSWHENHTRHFCSFSLISFLSGLSLALNKEGCDWQDRHSARANSGRATHLSQTRYTPLVEVNQAIFAWSFRQTSVYPRENLSTLKIMRSVPACLALNLCLTWTNIDWQADSNITFYTLPGPLMFSGSSLILKKAQI